MRFLNIVFYINHVDMCLPKLLKNLPITLHSTNKIKTKNAKRKYFGRYCNEQTIYNHIHMYKYIYVYCLSVTTIFRILLRNNAIYYPYPAIVWQTKTQMSFRRFDKQSINTKNTPKAYTTKHINSILYKQFNVRGKTNLAP